MWLWLCFGLGGWGFGCCVDDTIGAVLGAQLHFLPKTQRLYLIDVCDVKRSAFRYGNHVFAGTTETSSLSVYEMCGPTFPGTFVEEKSKGKEYALKKKKQNGDDASPSETDARTYVLQYSGVAFFFPVPRQFQALYEQNDKIPFEFPDGTTAPLERFCVFPPDANFLTIHEYPDEFEWFVRVRCHLPTNQWSVQTPDSEPITLHMTPQQVIDALGTPQGEFHPEPKYVSARVAVVVLLSHLPIPHMTHLLHLAVLPGMGRARACISTTTSRWASTSGSRPSTTGSIASSSTRTSQGELPVAAAMELLVRQGSLCI